VIDGVLVIDKPEGMTSHDVVQCVRRWARQRRVGHLGTLDPLATGVLPLALGEATKLSKLLTHGEKEYTGEIRLGEETTTYDREGEVVKASGPPWPSLETVRAALARFEGTIQQVPPPYSAVKQGGEPAFRRARRGEHVELEPRTVQIHRIDLLRYDAPMIGLTVSCSAGTYLRSLAHDLGLALGTGAHLWKLCRTRSGPFALDQAVRLEELDTLGESRLIPMAGATGLPTYPVSGALAARVARGVQLGRQEVRGAPAEGLLQLVRDGRLVALLEASAGLPELRTVRVFLEGTAA
jgi:tRNA pseudouridine55 synthase